MQNVDWFFANRVSLKGIGPQFVTVTVNEPNPISPGNEGRSDLRKFNMNVVPIKI